MIDAALFFATMRGPSGPVQTGTITDFPYQMDFVNDTYVGGTQPYGNNNDANNRFFRDSGVSNACFIPNAAGGLTSTAALGMRRSTKGTISFQNVGTLGLWNRDLTQAGTWIATSITPLKNHTGADGSANAASLLTAGANGGTILQATTSASANRVAVPFVKRVSGTGTVEFTFDGTNYTDITASIGAGVYAKCLVTASAITNPNFGFRLGTSGDSIAVDFVNVTGQLQGVSIDPMHYPTIVGSAFGSIFHETPWALNTDKGPTGTAPNILSQIIKADYAAFWQGYNYVADLGGLWVSDGVTNCKLLAGNNVQFSASVNLNTTGGEWKPNGQLNKVLAYLDASLNMALCVNGGVVYRRTAGVLSPAATHFVLSNNGAATLPLNGWTEKFAIGAGLTFTDLQMQALTT
jgi:hypothetical protein